MQEGSRAQKNAGLSEGSEECRTVSDVRRMQEGYRALCNAGGFKGSDDCRKVEGL